MQHAELSGGTNPALSKDRWNQIGTKKNEILGFKKFDSSQNHL